MVGVQYVVKGRREAGAAVWSERPMPHETSFRSFSTAWKLPALCDEQLSIAARQKESGLMNHRVCSATTLRAICGRVGADGP